jgi:hypothetical protein
MPLRLSFIAKGSQRNRGGEVDGATDDGGCDHAGNAQREKLHRQNAYLFAGQRNGHSSLIEKQSALRSNCRTPEARLLRLWDEFSQTPR